MGIVIVFGVLALCLALSFFLVPLGLLGSMKRRIDDPLTSAGARRGYIYYRTALFAVLAASLPILAGFGLFFSSLTGGSQTEGLMLLASLAIYLVPGALVVAVVFYVLGRVELSKASSD
jgi:putative exporter of polyketide antibiotics